MFVIEYAKQNRLLVVVGGAQEEGNLPSKPRPLKVTCSRKLVSTSLRNHCILKYYKQEKKPPWFLLVFAAWRVRERTEPTARASAVSRAFSRVSARSCSAENKRSGLGFSQHLPDSFRHREERQHLRLAVTLPLRMCSRIFQGQSGRYLVF